MKRKPLALALLSVTVMGAAMMSSCKKDATTSTPRSVSAPGVIPSSPTLSGVLGNGHTVADTIHLVASTAWHLSGLVYVDSLDVLIIDAGTKIYGDLSTSTSVPGGGLVITRGAKIQAEGTATSPIVFTSAATTPASGDWSGVVILGNASSNTDSRVQVEGIPTNPPANATFGGSVGTNDADNSGILKYVRIEYGGYELSTDNEINGLTLAGVGSGTTIDYVEVFKSKDDSFEWFGGTVNASHILSIDGLDDMFDTDNGYRGTISYALGVSDTTRADKSTSNGFESDNNATGSSAIPLTSPTYNYVTIVGVSNVWTSLKTNGAPSGTGKYGRAAHLRRNARYTINNSIFLGFYYGVSKDTQFGTAQGTFSNTYAEAFSFPFLTESNGASQAAITPAGTTGGSVTQNANEFIQLASPFDRSSITNFETTGLSPDGGTAGAFANGNWASTGTWVRLK